jgi:hypothetical protein
MLPLETFVLYNYTHLSLFLLLHRGLGFLWKEHLLYCNLLFLRTIHQNTKRLHHLLFYLSNMLINTFSSSWVRQPFIIERYYDWSLALGIHHIWNVHKRMRSIYLWIHHHTWLALGHIVNSLQTALKSINSTSHFQESNVHRSCVHLWCLLTLLFL